MNSKPSKEKIDAALYRRVGEKLQKKIAGSTVAICGLGGLGSNIAVSLARAGVGKLILIDFDKVDVSNLNRQQYKMSQVGMYKAEALKDNISEITLCTEVVPYIEKIDEYNYKALVSGADIICEAFDLAEEKSRFVNLVLENMPDKYLIAASGMAGLGPANKIITRRISEHFYLCGDGVSDVSNGDVLFSSGAMLCAAHQAHTVLRIIAEKFDV